jgi:hypothetical protein
MLGVRTSPGGVPTTLVAPLLEQGQELLEGQAYAAGGLAHVFGDLAEEAPSVVDLAAPGLHEVVEDAGVDGGGEDPDGRLEARVLERDFLAHHRLQSKRRRRHLISVSKLFKPSAL